MRFEICPACHLTTYSARLQNLTDDVCPACGAPLERPGTERGGSSWRASPELPHGTRLSRVHPDLPAR
jgi:hypothetical protein